MPKIKKIKAQKISEILFAYLEDKQSVSKFYKIKQFFRDEFPETGFDILMRKFFLYFFIYNKREMTPKNFKNFIVEYRNSLINKRISGAKNDKE